MAKKAASQKKKASQKGETPLEKKTARERERREAEQKRLEAMKRREERRKEGATATVDQDPDALLTVRPGRVLLWPDGVRRGGDGYVVRADDPFIGKFKGVLVPAPEGATPSPIGPKERTWKAKMMEMDYQHIPPDAREVRKAEAAKKAREEAEGAPDPDGLPAAEA